MKEDKELLRAFCIFMSPTVKLGLSPGPSDTERRLKKLLKESEAKLQVPWSIPGPTEGRDCQRLPRHC